MLLRGNRDVFLQMCASTAHLLVRKKPGISICIPNETLDVLQLDQPKTFQNMWYVPTSLDQWVSQAWGFFPNYTFAIRYILINFYFSGSIESIYIPKLFFGEWCHI